MFEFVLVITLLSLGGPSVEMEVIDGFPSEQECEKFFESWKTDLQRDNEILADMLKNDSITINGQCKYRRPINRKFG